MADPDRQRRRVVATAVALVALVVAGCGGDDGRALAHRRAEVAARGAQVMPFDLDATTHTFTEADDGGIQTVTVDDPADAHQIRLVRVHLRVEREKFSRGVFEDPATIHGHDMDGMAELAAGHRDITVTYTDVPGGGRGHAVLRLRRSQRLAGPPRPGRRSRQPRPL